MNALKELERRVLGGSLRDVKVGGVPLKEKIGSSDIEQMVLVALVLEEGHYVALNGIEPLMKAEATSFYPVISDYSSGGLFGSATIVGVVNPERLVAESGKRVLTEAEAENVLSKLGSSKGACRALYGELRMTNELRSFRHEPPLWAKQVFSSNGSFGYAAVSLQYRAMR